MAHELEGKPIIEIMVTNKFSQSGADGWSWILSDLKSLLEIGKRLGGCLLLAPYTRWDPLTCTRELREPQGTQG